MTVKSESGGSMATATSPISSKNSSPVVLPSAPSHAAKRASPAGGRIAKRDVHRVARRRVSRRRSADMSLMSVPARLFTCGLKRGSVGVGGGGDGGGGGTRLPQNRGSGE